jgi:hypothetical protein
MLSCMLTRPAFRLGPGVAHSVENDCIMHKGPPKRDTWDRVSVEGARHGLEHYKCPVCKADTLQVRVLQVQ